MKKIIIATAAFTLMCGSAFAQGTTGPAGQSDNMQKPGMTKTDNGGAMNKGTTGMTNGTSGSMSNSGMSNSGMKPDASGQGGSGASSDQGGTKTGNMK